MPFGGKIGRSGRFDQCPFIDQGWVPMKTLYAPGYFIQKTHIGKQHIIPCLTGLPRADQISGSP